MSNIIYRKSIFVTAFKPFGSRTINSSMEAVKNIKSDAQVKILDVSFSKTPKEVIDILDNNPDMLILTGEAGGRSKVSLEYVAINHYNANMPDNDGVIIKDKKIIDNGENAYFSNVPCYEINSMLEKKGFNSYVSLTAGSFVCNLSYYIALNYIKEKGLKTKVLFIHFPIEENNTNSLLIDEVISFLSK